MPMFADAGHPSEKGQHGVIGGILICELVQGSLFHVLMWRSRLSKRTVKGIGAAETMATGGTVGEGILISASLS